MGWSQGARELSLCGGLGRMVFVVMRNVIEGRRGLAVLALMPLLVASVAVPTAMAQDAADADQATEAAPAEPPTPETEASNSGSGNGPDLNDPNATAQWLVEWLQTNSPTFVVAVAKVLIILFVGFLVSGWAARIIRAQGDKRKKIDTTLARFIANIVRWAIIAFAAILCLGAFGFETTSFAALIAAAGLAIGLALQGSLSNFAAGAMLLIFRPFKVGQYVTAGGESGTVQEIDLLTTTLDTPQNVRVIVPNSTIFSSEITNYSHHTVRRCDIEVGVSYDADIDRTREVLQQAIDSIEECVSDRDSVPFLKGLGGSSVDWVCRIWVPASEFWSVHEKATRAVKVHLDNAGISIPFPQMDVHLDRTDQPGT